MRAGLVEEAVDLVIMAEEISADLPVWITSVEVVFAALHPLYTGLTMKLFVRSAGQADLITVGDYCERQLWSGVILLS